MQKRTTFFLLKMIWFSGNGPLSTMVGSKNRRFFFSTFRAELPSGDGNKIIVLPAVKEFTSFIDSGVTVNESGMAEGIGGEKSLGVTFFDPYGFFWRKFTTFPPFSYQNQPEAAYANIEQIGLRCDVYLCETTGDPTTIIDAPNIGNTETHFLFHGQVSGQPIYDFNEKTLSITLSSRNFNTERGYIPKLDYISMDSPGYNFLAAFLNEEMWPDIYGMAQHYPAVPILKNPYFQVSVNKIINYGDAVTRLYLKAGDDADDIFFDPDLPGNSFFFGSGYAPGRTGEELIYLFTGSSSEQFGGSFAYKAVGRMGVDYYTDVKGRLSRYLFIDINPSTITHYWYRNIPVTRLNDPSAYNDPINPRIHVAERVKIKLTGYGSYAEGGAVTEVPWLQHMWVRLQMTDDSIGDTVAITAKVVKQEGAICTLDWVSDCTPGMILWAGRAAGPPLLFEPGTKVMPYKATQPGQEPYVQAYWDLVNTYVIDTKILDQGTDINILDVSLPNGQNGYSSLPPNAFQKLDGTFFKDTRLLSTGANRIGSCGHITVDGYPGFGPWFWLHDGTVSRPHEFCRFIKLRGREGILRFLCEEEFHRVQGSDLTYQIYVTAETYTVPEFCIYDAVAKIMLECREKKAVWGYDYTTLPPEKNPRWDLGDFYPDQMSDVEAMAIIAASCGLIKSRVNEKQTTNRQYYLDLMYKPNNKTISQYECYPVNFRLKEKKTALSLINEISWQKGKVIRQRSERNNFLNEADFIIETVDLRNLVSDRCKEIKNWLGGTERPAFGTESENFAPGQNFSRYNYINSTPGERDPLSPVQKITPDLILDDGIQFSVSPEANLITQMNTRVFLNRADDIVDVERVSSSIRYFGQRKISAPIDYYAYAGRDTVTFLDFWLYRLSRPRLRITFNAKMCKDILNLNIFDIVEIQPGTTLFLNSSFGIPPMYRILLDNAEPESFVFKEEITDCSQDANISSDADLPFCQIQKLSPYSSDDLIYYPICGRIINKKIDPVNASVELTIEIENIKGHWSPDNKEGKQSPIGAGFDIDGGIYIESPIMQRGLPSPYDLIEGHVKIEDVLAEDELETWLS